MIRLLKPLEYYRQKYGTTRYGLAKLYLMMEKQHNRGQDGAGLACVSLGAKVGEEYMFRERAEGKDAITKIFDTVDKSMAGEAANGMTTDAELLMGHLRYSTTGRSGLKYVHPFLRRNNWRAKNLALCGNFNMTNIDEVFGKLTAQGQSPRFYGDAYITLELMGHRLDREVERLYAEARQRQLRDTDITRYIDDHVEMGRVLRSTMPLFDGGYVMCGITGSGEMFAVRDPWGIRPAFWYQDDEVVVVASERPVIQTCFNLDADRIVELLPGQSLTVKRCGEVSTEQIVPPQETRKCSFERIYFSRGSDCDIYRERKQLGRLLTPAISRAIGGDVANTVFSYIPNTAEVAFYGMTDGMRQMHGNIRVEKVVWKDIKLRTFISDVGQRNDLAAHVYDVSYGSLRPYEDNLVIIDDSIVRGTTLREDCDGVELAADTLSRLLRHRHVASGGAVRLPCGSGSDRGARHGPAHQLCLPRLQGATNGCQPRQTHIRAVHRRGDKRKDGPDVASGRDGSTGGDGVPKHRGPASGLPRPSGRLVFHRPLPHPRRHTDGEPRLRWVR